MHILTNGIYRLAEASDVYSNTTKIIRKISEWIYLYWPKVSATLFGILIHTRGRTQEKLIFITVQINYPKLWRQLWIMSWIKTSQRIIVGTGRYSLATGMLVRIILKYYLNRLKLLEMEPVEIIEYVYQEMMNGWNFQKVQKKELIGGYTIGASILYP